MKKLKLIVIFLLALSGPVLAQDGGGSTLDLGRSLENYKRATIDQNVDQVLSFTYPGMFKMMSKEKMRSTLLEVYTSGATPKMKQMTFAAPSAPRPYSKGQFVAVNYHVQLEMPRPGDATPQIDQFVITMMKRQLGEQTQIVIDEKNGLIKVSRDTAMIVLNENNQGWKIIEIDNLAWLIDNKALPEDLISMLK